MDPSALSHCGTADSAFSFLFSCTRVTHEVKETIEQETVKDKRFRKPLT